jgi:hypothetical protein
MSVCWSQRHDVTRVLADIACSQTPSGLQLHSEVCVEFREVLEKFAGRATDAGAV